MAARAIFVLCASALVVQCALGQCVGRLAEPLGPCRGGLGYDGFGFEGLGVGYEAAWPRRTSCGAISLASLSAAYGGGLPVASSSCAAPTGLAVTSENVYEGCVGVAGNLPFLGTAAMEGVFPTAGMSAVSYGCGDGAVGITAEAPVSTAYGVAGVAAGALGSAAFTPATFAPAGAAPWGYRGAQPGGCGCGASYLY